MKENMIIGIAVSKTHPEITSIMLERAKRRITELDAEVGKIIHVEGSFDTPLAVKKLLESDDIDGVIVLGAVIKGETNHDMIVAETAARALTELSLNYGKPVGLGVIGPGATWQQAVARKEQFAVNSVNACINMIKELNKI